MITGTRDPKICSEQERADQTLSEKLDQTNGGICPPDIDPGMKAPTPHAGSLRQAHLSPAAVNSATSMPAEQMCFHVLPVIDYDGPIDRRWFPPAAVGSKPFGARPVVGS